MTSQRILFGALVLLAATGALAACGGSSSETPPPLQPDPKGFRYAAAAPPVQEADDSDAGVAPESDPKPRAPSRPTPSSAPAAH